MFEKKIGKVAQWRINSKGDLFVSPTSANNFFWFNARLEPKYPYWTGSPR